MRRPPEEDDPRVYAALAMPNAAIENGGVEILRAGIIEDELHIVLRRAFKDPRQWGEVLVDATQRLAKLYAAETKRTEKDVIAAIAAAFAGLGGGAGARKAAPRKQPAHKTKRKSAPKSARNLKSMRKNG